MIRIVTSITLASGGLAAAAYAAMGVATADPDATTITVPDPFGFTLEGSPNITYETSDASESIAYGNQTIDFDSANISSSVEQFFTNNDINTTALTDAVDSAGSNGLPVDIIDKLQTGGESQQQILLPEIPGTNIDSGVIGIHDFGDGYGYAYIDLVGPGNTALNSDGVANAIGAFLITPTGTYDVSQWEDGGDYGDLAYQENKLFDLTNPVSDPFGTLVNASDGTYPDPGITYQTGGVFGNTAYGTETFDLDSGQLPSFAENFFDDNVTTADGQPLDLSTLPSSDLDVQANIIDKVDFSGLFNNFADQQILLPSIAGTDIDHGVIDIENLGNGYSYDYIDLVESQNGTALPDAIGAWLVTPEGAIDVSSFAGSEAAMFDPSYFIDAFPPADLTPPLDFLL
jgi:hypothetical protein